MTALFQVQVIAVDLTQLAADLTTLRAAFATVGSITTASDADIASIFTPLSACIADTENALANCEAEMLNTDGAYVAGVQPNVDGATQAAAFLLYLRFNDQAAVLSDMNSRLNRMAQNIIAYQAKVPRNATILANG